MLLFQKRKFRFYDHFKSNIQKDCCIKGYKKGRNKRKGRRKTRKAEWNKKSKTASRTTADARKEPTVRGTDLMHSGGHHWMCSKHTPSKSDTQHPDHFKHLSLSLSLSSLSLSLSTNAGCIKFFSCLMEQYDWIMQTDLIMSYNIKWEF